MHIWEHVTLVVFLAGLLVASLSRGAELVVKTPEHVTLAKDMLDGALVVRAGLLQHFVEHARPPWGLRGCTF